MVTNAEQLKKKLLHKNQAPLPMFKIFSDPRFIIGGKFLSATGIDELPQLFNVLRGEMSLVGPRPLPLEEAAKLPKSWHFRFLVKPGLFSHWSASQDRHKSLRHWKDLELQTLVEGGPFSDAVLIVQIIITILKTVIKSLLRHLFHTSA
jgi:lipopolysaccharide/colanic/teichoic acid biosynthesis glycosyltransferase